MHRLATYLAAQTNREVVETVEPGGTSIGKQARKILLDPANSDICPRAELLLYFASRAQNVEEIIRPALHRNATVLCDRFTDSTLVYQGAGRGIDAETVLTLDRIACNGLQPDVTILIDLDLQTSLERARSRNSEGNQTESRIDDESTAFHSRVRDGYLALAQANPRRILVIDGRASIPTVGERIREALNV